MRILAIVFAGFLVSACSGVANVATPTVKVPSGIQQIPGKYAVLLQTGGWNLETKTEAWTCSAWDFDTGIDGAYNDAMRRALPQALEEVEFVGNPLKPAEISEKGYDAQVVLHQGNAKSTFGVQQRFWDALATGGVELEVILAVIDENGNQYQQTIKAEGTGQTPVYFGCDKVGEAIGAAGSSAVEDLVGTAVLYIRDGLMSQRIKKEKAGVQASSPEMAAGL